MVSSRKLNDPFFIKNDCSFLKRYYLAQSNIDPLKRTKSNNRNDKAFWPKTKVENKFNILARSLVEFSCRANFEWQPDDIIPFTTGFPFYTKKTHLKAYITGSFPLAPLVGCTTFFRNQGKSKSFRKLLLLFVQKVMFFSEKNFVKSSFSPNVLSGYSPLLQNHNRTNNFCIQLSY